MLKTFPTDFDIHLFHDGSLYEAYQTFGSHIYEEEGKEKTRFCVWAPHAKQVRLAGSFNNWNADGYGFERMNEEGVWVFSLPFNAEGALYKYEIETRDGRVLLKADPYAFHAELRPNTASIVYPLKNFKWNDKEWFKKKRTLKMDKNPLFIYEIHMGTWKLKEDGSYYSYREMADILVPYVKENGFTHVEIMPIVEHPYDRSWGYQGTGYYAPTSRYGKPEDFMYFVDQFHQIGIGIIMDWVPGHFCKDAHGLYFFDGEPLFDYQEESDRENRVWGTANFDLGKNEVHSFLISNARYWMDKYHIDGLRVDAVANIIFWTGNEEGTINPFAIDFLKKLNTAVLEYDPSFLMMAEDSTDWPDVTVPVKDGGLGFQYKWNMGWMNDVLTYMKADPKNRAALHNKITFSIMYAFSEKFLLPLSHDEVVHGKKSLLDKMPGTYEEKFAQLRLLYGYFIAHPGKKLLFMGGEFGHFSEWKDLEELDWHLLNYDMHQKMNAYIKELLYFYKRSKPLSELDHNHEGFEWIDVNNHHQSIFSFMRKGVKEDEFLIVICNFKNISYENYMLGVPKAGEYREVFNSDADKFGGNNHINKYPIKSHAGNFHGRNHFLKMNIPPFGITILRPVKKRKETSEYGENKMRGNALGRRKRKQA